MVPRAARAAQYLRMSTHLQPRSLENQATAIAEYAASRGLEIVRTFTDPGVSGLTFHDRPGLRALMAQVLSGTADYAVILVADVSRWGRFQDLDEAAHYEFLCREAGVSVRYCAEPADIADAPLGPLVKQLKRVLAAEFSRERSELVRSAQRAAAAAGLNPAGRVAYGVSRVLLDPTGERIGLLGRGERKVLQEQRVGFAPGPPAERAAVRTIFHRYVDQRLRMSQIAANMQACGAPRPLGGRWTASTVQRTLRNEIYIGIHIFNRATEALRTKSRPNPPSEWIRAQVMAPIVPVTTFQAAQALLALKSRYTDEDLLGAARRLLAETGRLTAALIEASPQTPAVKVYRKRFGSLAELYRRVGYSPGPVRRVTDAELIEALRRLHRRHGRATGPLLEADPSSPDPSTYHRRFGTLRRAYDLAGLDGNYLQARRVWRAERNARRAAVNG